MQRLAGREGGTVQTTHLTSERIILKSWSAFRELIDTFQANPTM